MWRHLVLGTRCSWLHGDARGFRSRGERIESTGDYKNPPPPGEHEGLRKYHQQRSHDAVAFDVDLRVIVCREFVSKMRELEIPIIACSAGKKHLHGSSDIVAPYAEMRKMLAGQSRKPAMRFAAGYLATCGVRVAATNG